MNEQNNEAAHEFYHLGITLERTGSWIKQKTVAKTSSYPALVDTDKCISVTPNNHTLQILWLQRKFSQNLLQSYKISPVTDCLDVYRD